MQISILNPFGLVIIKYLVIFELLLLDSNATYFVAPKPRSRVTDHYYLSKDPKLKPLSPLNGAVHIECKTLRHVVSSAAETEVGGVFHNAQATIPITPAPIKTGNQWHKDSSTTTSTKSAPSHGI